MRASSTTRPSSSTSPSCNVTPTQNFIGFDDYGDYVNFSRGMVKRGYSDEQISGILGANYLRVFEEVCG